MTDTTLLAAVPTTVPGYTASENSKIRFVSLVTEVRVVTSIGAATAAGICVNFADVMVMGTAKAITQSRSSGLEFSFQQSLTFEPLPFTPAKALPFASLNAPASTKTLYNRFGVQVELIVTFVPSSD